jgi:CubicO group peptidase (beta-lactamase class C family)
MDYMYIFAIIKIFIVHLSVMPTTPSTLTLQTIAESGHVPAVSYAYVEPKADGTHEFVSTAITVGKKNEAEATTVDSDTRFPASSLSKILFTYLVLQLVKDGKLDLDEPLHETLPYERFLVDGEYPEKAKRITARHVLSHTTGLPNLGAGLSSTLRFNPESELGEGYSYSGEALLYLQKVIETKMGKDLEELAKEYVFDPLGMERSTFLPQPADDTNVVAVHTALGHPTPIYKVEPELCSAGSLLTTGEDFSKFMGAWLENIDDPIIGQAFKPTSADDFPTCGLGWHIYRNKDTGEVIAYQFGENPNTRAFVAINLTEKKGAVFFTNSENGMSIAHQVFSSPALAPIGNMEAVYKHLYYTQCDEPGWKETISGKVAEDKGKFEEARGYFERALALSPDDESKKRRLEWFNTVHHPSLAGEFTTSLETFVGHYKNSYNDEVGLSIKDGSLTFKQFDQEIKLVRISETEFLPEKDQSFKISFDGGKMSIHSIYGYEKSLSKEPAPTPQSEYKEAVRELRESQRDYMRSTESSRAKEREKHVDTAPKPPWRP